MELNANPLSSQFFFITRMQPLTSLRCGLFSRCASTLVPILCIHHWLITEKKDHFHEVRGKDPKGTIGINVPFIPIGKGLHI